MAVFFVTGKLGSGKSLCAVGRIRDYLLQGRRIATNLDLYLEGLLPPHAKCNVIRLPDYPRVEDFDLLGTGDPLGRVDGRVNEDRYGLIVLDELAMQFNSRAWRDSDRLNLINWFRHARKLRWDIIFLAQDIESIDSQIVNALCEHLVICRRLDKLGIPFISPIMNFMGFTKILPKVHIASVYYAQKPIPELKVCRWWYRGTDIYNGYDTEQKFSDGMITVNGQIYDSRASYSYIPPYHTSGVSLIDSLENRINLLRENQNNAVKSSSNVIVKKKPNAKPVLLQPFKQKYNEFIFPSVLLIILLLFLSYHYIYTVDSIDHKGSLAMLFGISSTPKPQAIEKKQESSIVPTAQVKPVVENSVPKFDYIHTVLESTYVVVSSMVRDGSNVVSLIIKARDEKNDLVRFITYDNLKLMGYTVIVTSSGIEVIRGDYHKPVPFS